jgi:hypothetical protein
MDLRMKSMEKEIFGSVMYMRDIIQDLRDI